MLDVLGDTNAAALVGLIGGVLLGLAARLGRFCTLGAIEDLLYAGSSVRMRMWGIAIGTAMTGSFGLMQLGLLNAPDASYLQFGWVPWASVAGGLVFGYGMAMAGNCGFGALARLGGGDLRSFVIVLVMGLAAYVAISGPLAKLRVAAFPMRPLDPGETLPGIAHLVERMTGLSAPVFGMALGVVIVAAMFTTPDMRKARKQAFWALNAGLAIVIGWGGTQWVLDTGFTPVPVESHTYSAPLGDTILYLMTASGTSLNFGVGSVAGVLVGAFIGSALKGHFRWEACEDPRELKRQIGGAVLMGFGAVVAFGCSIGQGLSAFSLLYYGAPVTFLAIMAGAALGLRHLISGFAPAE
ncbi:YeeE/YedE family protein [Maritimibacter sp. UBA3975]|uniref:YeeE/YedE family protein n=1 Tax=Maritimibacter sp. UBA3975 TaxID=1946833 RepID=UPI000C0A5412|nr:YeeE/YedE family protein [Maritimibacter sp. UBA3975]MAM60299.1 YeeE/YedE family protein [Maritimibacter sp.]|tara:strand:+ start:41196 stop:42257 length:1062 start_codon:yes stop_codon:yes gene_type:complete